MLLPGRGGGTNTEPTEVGPGNGGGTKWAAFS